MPAKNWTESDIKNLIKDTIKQELKGLKKDIEDIKIEQKKLTDKEEVKEMVRETIVNMYKFFWQKSSNYIRQI